MPPHHPVSGHAAYPRVAEIRAALDARDWSGCRKLLDAVPPVERERLITAGGEVTGIEDFLRCVLIEDPADSTAGALLARHLIASAQPLRTVDRAAFHARLRAAELVLIDAAARTPDDPSLWTARIATARDLELGGSEARRRHARLAGIDTDLAAVVVVAARRREDAA